MKPKTLINGEPWELESGMATTHTCCDCGLEHIMIAEIKGSKIQLRFYRDDYQTKKNNKGRTNEHQKRIHNHQRNI